MTPPTTRGVSRCRCSALPGSIRSGLNATNTSVPTRSPRCRQRLGRAAPGWCRRSVVEVRMIVWPGRAWLHHGGARAAQRGQVGRVVAVHRGRHADDDRVGASAMAAGSVVSSRVPSASAASSRSRSGSPRSASRAKISRSRCWLTSIPMIRAAPAVQRHRGRQPDIAQARRSPPTSVRPVAISMPVASSARSAVRNATSLLCSRRSRPLTASESW